MELLMLCEFGGVQDFLELRKKSNADVLSDKEQLDAALQVAAANGNEHAVTFLLSLGADVNGVNLYGWTPLMQACRQGQTATAIVLLGRGAQADKRNRFGTTALTCAVRSGHVATVHAILDSGGSCVTQCGSDNAQVEVTPMMVAAQLGHDPILRVLLDAGSDVNHSSFSTGVTPLIIAAANGHMRTAQILTDKGADVATLTRCGRTALDVAIANKRRQVRCFLEQKMLELKFRKNALRKFDIFEAIKSGRSDEVRDVLSLNSSKFAEIRSEDGVTPLMCAAQMGNSTIVELLMAVGVDLDAADTAGGLTALMFALFHGYNEIAFRLIDAGANVNARAHGGFVAFDIATIIGATKPELIKYLAKNTDEEFLHPLANILCQDEPHERPSRSRKAYASFGRTLGRLRVPKFHRGTKSADPVPEISSKDTTTRPLGSASSMPLILLRKSSIEASPPNTLLDSYSSADWMSSDSSGSNIDRISLPIIMASPCLMATRKSPVRPAPPLLPSMGLDSSIAAGNVNMSMNLPFGQGAIFADGKRSSKPSMDIKNPLENHRSVKIHNSTNEEGGELYEVLKKHSLEHYKFVFDKEEVDLEAFKMLTDMDLVNLAIEDESIRNRLLQVIAKLNSL